MVAVALEEALQDKAPCEATPQELPDVLGAGLHAVGVCAALTAAQISFAAALALWQPQKGNM